MPFTVKPLRTTSSSVSGSIDESTGKKTAVTTITQDYHVYATGFAAYEDVTDIQAACAAGLPTVNETTWYSAEANVTVPQAVCTSVDVKRHPTKAFLFEATAEFQTPELTGDGCAVAPPASLADIDPSETSRIGSYERVLYADKDGNQCWKLPGTKTPFSAPITETIPVFSLTIIQYEASLTYEQQIERSFKTNSGTYRGKGAGLWLIGAVAASEVTVQLAGGPTTAVKVTYPITLSERFYYPPGVSATEANKVIYGWDKVHPLVDTMKISTDSDAGPTPPRLVPMQDDESAHVRTGYINTSGYERTATEGSNDDRPDYLRFKTQDQIDFSSFLQI